MLDLIKSNVTTFLNSFMQVLIEKIVKLKVNFTYTSAPAILFS